MTAIRGAIAMSRIRAPRRSIPALSFQDRRRFPAGRAAAGAIPWLLLQIALVAVVILWPESVTYWIDAGSNVDPASVTIDVPTPGMGEDEPPPVIFK